MIVLKNDCSFEEINETELLGNWFIVSIKEVRQERKELIEVMSRQFRIWCVLLFFGRFG